MFSHKESWKQARRFITQAHGVAGDNTGNKGSGTDWQKGSGTDWQGELCAHSRRVKREMESGEQRSSALRQRRVRSEKGILAKIRSNLLTRKVRPV